MPLFTISSPSQFRQKIQRSEFICFLFPISDVEQAREIISAHNREYANATHNCYAYICGFAQETQYYSDAGEPHGTAGKPILNSLLRGGMTNCLAIVTRYYGGIKLGVKGLIDAYGGTVEEALSLAARVEAVPQVSLEIKADYAIAEIVGARVKDAGGIVHSSEWADRVTIRCSLPLSEWERFRELLDGWRLQSRLDYRIEE